VHDYTAAWRSRGQHACTSAAALGELQNKNAIGSSLRGSSGACEALEPAAATRGAVGRLGCHADATCEQWEATAEGQQGSTGGRVGQE
jgi:hypothetical protein